MNNRRPAGRRYGRLAKSNILSKTMSFLLAFLLTASLLPAVSLYAGEPATTDSEAQDTIALGNAMTAEIMDKGEYGAVPSGFGTTGTTFDTAIGVDPVTGSTESGEGEQAATAPAAASSSVPNNPAAGIGVASDEQTDDDPVPVTPDDDATADAAMYTVTFMVGSTHYITHSVEDGTIYEEDGSYYSAYPTDPTIPSGMVSFRGWFLADATEPFDFSMSITEDITLTAVFDSRYLIQYYSGEGSTTVAFSEEVSPGAAIPRPSTADEQMVTPAGQYIEYWFFFDDGEPVAIDFAAPPIVSGDMKLYPKFRDMHYVLFVSAGTPIENPVVLVKNGTTVAKPPTPTRAGYTFLHWSLMDNGTDPAQAFDFSVTPITENTTLYAVWQAQIVNYTVAIWMEKPNIAGAPTHADGDKSQYNYVRSVTLQGTAGSLSDVTGVTQGVGGLFTTDALLKYAEFQDAEQQVIQGNGLTVVNACAKRKVYTYIFNLGGDKRSLTIDGTTYTGGNNAERFSLEVKYEMDISSLFPVQGVDFATFSSGFQSWSRDSNMSWETGSGIASRRNVVDPGMLSRNGDVLTYTLAANWGTASSSYEYRYLAEILPGQTAMSSNSITRNGVTYIVMDEYSQTYSANNLGQKAINGLAAVGNQSYLYYYRDSDGFSTNSGTGRTAMYCFFYTRSQHTLSFNMLAPASGVMYAPSSKQLKYGESLGGYEPGTNPTRTGYTFDGWYKDADYKQPFDFESATMPNGPMVVYAKWQSQDHTVAYHDAEGDVARSSEGVANGAYVENPPYQIDDAVEGKGIFLGWYYLVTGVQVPFFADETQVFKDYELYAKFRTEGFTLTYDAGGGSAVPPEALPTDGNTYDLDSETRVADGAGLQGSDEKVFYAWSDGRGGIHYPGSLIEFTYGNITLTALYALPSELIRLTYNSNYPDASGPATFHQSVLRGTIPTLLGQGDFAYRGYEFAGWATTPSPGASDMIYRPGDPFIEMTENGNVYAVWSVLEYSVSYLPGECGTWAENAYVTDDLRYGVTTPVFSGNTLTDHESGYYFIGWTPDVAATVTADATYVAQWAAQTPITITAASGSKVYDGIPLAIVEAAVSEGALKEGDVLSVTMTAASAITNVGSIENEVMSYGIMRTASDGSVVDVTQEYATTIEMGTLEVTPRSVTLVSATSSKVYTGTPLIDNNVTIGGEGFVSGEGVTFSVTGTITNVGTVPNSFTYVLNQGTLAGNYSITTETGMLTITQVTEPLIVNVAGATDSAVYDGGEKSVAGWSVSGDLPASVTVTITDGTLAYAARTDAGTTYMGLTPEMFSATSPNYENIVVEVEDGFITLTPRAVIVSADNQSKVEGAADPVLTATVNGLVVGDSFDYSLVRDVGEAPGDYAINVIRGINPNYEVETIPAVFTITPAVIPPVSNPDPDPPVAPVIPATPVPAVVVPAAPAPVADDPIVEIPAAETPLAPTPTPAPATTPDDEEDAPIRIIEAPTPSSSSGGSYWALLNLILALLGALVALIVFITYFIRRKTGEAARGDRERSGRYDEQGRSGDERRRKRLWPRIVAIVLAAAGCVLFCLTEDMTLPMTFVDDWTIWQALVFVLVVFCVAIGFVKKSDDSSDGCSNGRNNDRRNDRRSNGRNNDRNGNRRVERRNGGAW
ncbi:MAG TPA: hypothetical protein DEB24_08050 [Coriobacteriia bacterium]|nr:hypothetical protein [Coriobacteriia bacterium]